MFAREDELPKRRLGGRRLIGSSSVRTPLRGLAVNANDLHPVSAVDEPAAVLAVRVSALVALVQEGIGAGVAEAEPAAGSTRLRHFLHLVVMCAIDAIDTQALAGARSRGDERVIDAEQIT